jgi:hypothetical protein
VIEKILRSRGEWNPPWLRPAALEITCEEIETDELARAAMHSASFDEEAPAGQVLGIDLQTAFILKELLGPPRAHPRLRRRG